MSALITVLAAASMANADIRPLLREQGFEDLLNGRETIAYVGEVQQGQNDFQIFTYRGVFRAAVVDHGVNWIFVVQNGSNLLGGYHIGSPANDCEVQGQKVICKPPEPGLIEFTERGPPYEILFGGEVLHFEYGSRPQTGG